MTNGKLQSCLQTQIEQQEYITNNAISKKSENNSNRVNSAEQRLFLKQNYENRLKRLKPGNNKYVSMRMKLGLHDC